MPERRSPSRPWSKPDRCYCCGGQRDGKRKLVCSRCYKRVWLLRVMTPEARAELRDEMDLAEAVWRIATDPPPGLEFEPAEVGEDGGVFRGRNTAP
jgi:hypothetical protein